MAIKRQIYKTKVVRNIDQELGNLYSMSWGRRAFFGSNIDKFEQEFRHGLAGIKWPSGFENIIRFEAYFLHKTAKI
jgi:hypothetical protein